ncbi:MULTISPECIES: alpha/beta hydrolase [unclassified Sulfitobacter]|uniref:alpha/beta hydrolase n=1 Tax=unclassified Sulfitobacter TaxID=196795 RepID=UPI0007C3D916|nr:MULTISPECIES: alpha/beta fold hydrolase [unclassified Sulfitobacter]KZY00658.1 hypothetical protein A3721_05280 [Sulfitobacter sp. HI0023]KZY25845.1 hypothetical protein A3728_17765 [Sulfitobacter sp. HI0040]KZZ64519.1 hypothetical protein A3764_04385 [Sulfitobacter sp. HI0129]
MSRFARFILGILIVLALLAAALWVFGPYEEDNLDTSFDVRAIEEGVDAYFAAAESVFDDITPGVEKQVIWAGEPDRPTGWSVLYVHGFSATSQEIRPVPDKVAEALGANLVLTRLRGHGRGADALAEGSVPGWMHDMAEGLAVARAVGERVLVIATSTGGTLATAAAAQPVLMEQVAGIVMVSPNFEINSDLAGLLTWPAARHWLPKLAGERRSFEPRNPEQATYWTTEYPSVATLPVGVLINAVDRLDLGRIEIPALFWFSDNDTVVRPAATRAIAERWGGPVTIVNPELGPRDDPSAHVIAGDILSPEQTTPTVAGILDWVGGL